MTLSNTTRKIIATRWVYVGLMLLIIAGCGSSDDTSTGYIKFYNASTNAPGVFLTVDENLDEDDDDEIELTYSAVEYSKVSANNQLDTGNYYVELAWQDEESSDRSDLALIYQEQLGINSDSITFVTLIGDIRTAEILTYNIDVLDDDDDYDDDLFNLRVLNLHSQILQIPLFTVAARLRSMTTASQWVNPLIIT